MLGICRVNNAEFEKILRRKKRNLVETKYGVRQIFICEKEFYIRTLTKWLINFLQSFPNFQKLIVTNTVILKVKLERKIRTSISIL